MTGAKRTIQPHLPSRLTRADTIEDILKTMNFASLQPKLQRLCFNSKLGTDLLCLRSQWIELITSSRLVAPGSPTMGPRKIYDRKIVREYFVFWISYHQQTFWVASNVDCEVDHFICRKTKRTNVGRRPYWSGHSDNLYIFLYYDVGSHIGFSHNT